MSTLTIDLDTFSFDDDLGEYYSEYHNRYMSVDEYKQLVHNLTHIQCEYCDKELFIDEICWCGGE